MGIFNFKDFSFKTSTSDKLICEEITEISSGEISEYKLKLVFDGKISPSKYTISWELPQIDTVGFWSPKHHFQPNISADWVKRESISRITNSMPVVSLHSCGDENRLTISLSDTKTAIKIRAGVIEETAEIGYDIVLFDSAASLMDSYEVIIRFDRRKIPFYKAVETTKKWWEELGYTLSYEPKYASAPLYSAWYSFHQRTIPDEIIAQCKIAKEYGMDTLIVDDGWQTDDNSRGYGYCGDWEVCQTKIPDMKGFVDAIHDLDMKFMIWFNVPYVGWYSKNFERFKGMYLYERAPMKACILDPRFKVVREFIADKYVNFVKEYGIDGLKLDFIDSFELREESSKEYDKMDTISVEEGVDMLLSEISQKLKEINPEFLIEFRQSYIGPVISRYGNMFRVTDCPNDPLVNRTHSLTMRMSQNGIIHSDMMMWHKDETNEAVAYQLLSTMFSVPQISILFENITTDHKRILKNYISFWREHKDTVLRGEMEYADIIANYSMARASSDDESVSVLFQSVVNKVDNKKTNYVFNATSNPYVYIESDDDYTYFVYDVFGDKISEGSGKAGVLKITVPACGMIEIK